MSVNGEPNDQQYRSRAMSAKFVIYGQSRSGSTLLVELLNAYPDVQCDDELLNANAGYIRSKIGLKVIRRYPLPYFNYRRWRAGDKGYGFKLLLYQTHSPLVLNRLWRTGWRFLHVRRRDVVRQALSSIIASKTGHYHRRQGSEDPAYRVSITIDELDAALTSRERKTARELELIDGIDHLDVVYEDDLLREGDWPSTMAKVSRYLELEPFGVVEPSLKPTDDRSYEEVIENYEYLMNHLTRGEHDRAPRSTGCAQPQ